MDYGDKPAAAKRSLLTPPKWSLFAPPLTGWAGKILRVDLSAGSCASEPLNRDWAERYLGQRGLAAKYLAAEVDARVDPLDPANKLIFA